jgi:hypothetical protein
MGSQRTYLERLNGHLHVIYRAGGRSKVNDMIKRAFDINILRDVVVDESEFIITNEMADIIHTAC